MAWGRATGFHILSGLGARAASRGQKHGSHPRARVQDGMDD